MVFCIGAVVLLALKGFKGGWRYVPRLLLAEYVFLLYCSTVIFRHVSSVREYDFTPFWSYFAYFRGNDPQLLPENIMNVLVFIPLGLLLGLSFRSMTWLRALLIGACLSIGIEALQFIFMRGFAEFDDVMHNTLGCVIGYGLFRLLSRLPPISHWGQATGSCVPMVASQQSWSGRPWSGIRPFCDILGHLTGKWLDVGSY